MASGGIRVERRDSVLVLMLDHGTSNALDPKLRAALLSAVESPGPECRAIVLAATGANFSSALALDPDTAAPGLAALCAVMAQSPLPVVAALHGLVMGPGAELALAASARIAAPGCRIALPEIALGLCPEGGSTRRLPALIGAAAALRLLLTGRAIAVDEALAMGLVGNLAKGPLLDAAIALALSLAKTPKPLLVCETAAAHQAAVAAARRAHPKALPAVSRIIDCVEAALLLPPDAAQAFETVAREDLEQTPEAAALRAATKAERRAAALPPAVARSRPLPLDRLGLAGSDPALETLARAAMAQGVAVIWLRQSAGPPVMAEPTRLLHWTTDPADLVGVPLQVHEVIPDAALLRQLPQGAAVVVMGGAEGEMGLSVAPSARATELSVLAEEAAHTIATAVAGLRRIGMPPLLVGQRPVLGQRVVTAGDLALVQLARSGVPQHQLAEATAAFGARLSESPADPATPPRRMTATDIRNRWLAAMANEGLRALDQGIARRPSDVDHALVVGHGFSRWRGGPMHQAGLRGLMVLRHDLRQWAGEAPIWEPAPLLDRLIQDGLRLSALDG